MERLFHMEMGTRNSRYIHNKAQLTMCIFHWLYSMIYSISQRYAHGFVVLCFVVVMQSFIMYSHEVFIHIHQGCFAGTGVIVRLPQCQWSKPDGYEKISQCITTTKHSKAKTVCTFLGKYCMPDHSIGILLFNLGLPTGIPLITIFNWYWDRDM